MKSFLGLLSHLLVVCLLENFADSWCEGRGKTSQLMESYFSPDLSWCDLRVSGEMWEDIIIQWLTFPPCLSTITPPPSPDQRVHTGLRHSSSELSPQWDYQPGRGIIRTSLTSHLTSPHLSHHNYLSNCISTLTYNTNGLYLLLFIKILQSFH